MFIDAMTAKVLDAPEERNIRVDRHIPLLRSGNSCTAHESINIWPLCGPTINTELLHYLSFAVLLLTASRV